MCVIPDFDKDESRTAWEQFAIDNSIRYSNSNGDFHYFSASKIGSEVISLPNYLYPNIEVNGSIYIASGHSIPDINVLASIEKIYGNLKLSMNSLTSLYGISSIDYIEGYLSISNTALSNLDGFKVSNIGTHLTISNNNSLTDISALSNIDFLMYHLNISDNDMLTNIDGLEGIEYIGGNILLDGNAIDDLSGFSSYTALNGDLIIANNNLTNLDGMDNIQSINGDLDLSGNYDLEDIQALSNLEIIKGDLSLMSSSLKSLAGLEKLKEVGFINISSTPSTHKIDDITPLSNLEKGVIKVYSLSGLKLDSNSIFCQSPYTNIRTWGNTTYRKDYVCN